jgi:transposase
MGLGRKGALKQALSGIWYYFPDFNPIEKTFGAFKRRRNSALQETSVETIIVSDS